jgi:hypothetical protein
MKLKFLLLILSLFFATSVLADHHAKTSTSSEVEAITTAYDLYVKHFIESDYEGIASVMQLPLVQKADKTLIAVTKEEVIDLYRALKANIRPDYKYSTVDKIKVSKVIESIYSIDAYVTRYSDKDEVISKGQAVYFLNNDEGVWKIFYMQFFIK